MDSASQHHRDYPFLPAAASSPDGDGFYTGEPRNPAAGDSTDVFLFLAVPAGWLVRLAAFVGELVASAILSLVYPVAALIGRLRTVPAAVASLVRRAATGLLAAACTFVVLAAAFVVSLLLGFALVRHWVAEPVTARHPLYFDYTEAQPSAAVALGGGAVAALPAGHAVRVSMALLLPDSYHNRHIGVFQIKSEAMSASGITIASTTQPYMIKYKSSPIRLMQTALLCVPLTMGIRSERQSGNLKLLHYREGHGRHKRTGLIRVMLQPRATTVHLPQVYKAEIVVQTTLPWTKELARSLKWTLCVWVSLSVYISILVLAICWGRAPSAFSARDRRLYDHQVIEDSGMDMGDSGGRSDKELYGGVGVKWKQRIRKRKAQHGTLQGQGGMMEELKFTEGSTSGVAMDGE
uniref:Seipin n=1 Tax=Oryza punctata TaxID=4537 RepID=A0A0E0MJM5_ORYPU